MVKIDMKGFRAVQLKWGSVTIQQGGHLTKAMPKCAGPGGPPGTSNTCQNPRLKVRTTKLGLER